MTNKIGLALVAGAIAIGNAGSAMATTPGLDFASSLVVTNQSSRSLTVGYEFLATAPVTVDALAYFNYSASPSHAVGLWDINGSLLASATVSATDTLIGNFRYHSIGPITLQSGSLYVVGGLNLGSEWAYGVSGLQTASGITYIQNRYSDNGTLLTLPTKTYPSDGVGYFGGSVGIAPVPEPETYAMMMAGLGLLGFVARRRRTA